MKQLTLAIVGGGVAGLTFAVKASRIPYLKIKLFEKEDYFGGRILTKQVQKDTFADLGANIIDFQRKEQEKMIRSFLNDLKLTDKNQDKLLLLKQPFLIYQNELKLSEYNKERYCYKSGFKGLINDLVSQLRPDQFQLNYEIDSLISQNGNWELVDKSKKKYPLSFDYLVLATSGPLASEVLRKSDSKLLDLLKLRQEIQNVQYTKQISAAFQLKQAPSFSCILVKNRDVTFVSSHKQKYQQNTKSIAVIQFADQFSKNNVSKEGSELVQSLFAVIPLQMKNWLGKCIEVKKWDPSLIKNKHKADINKFQNFQNKLFIVGDICNGSSRVTGAMEASIELFNILRQKNDL